MNLQQKLENKILKKWSEILIPTYYSGTDNQPKVVLQLSQPHFERFLYDSYLYFSKNYSIQTLYESYRVIFKQLKLANFSSEQAAEVFSLVDLELFPHFQAINTRITKAGKWRSNLKPKRKWCSNCNVIREAEISYKSSSSSVDGYRKLCIFCDKNSNFTPAPQEKLPETHVDYLDSILSEVDNDTNNN